MLLDVPLPWAIIGALVGESRDDARADGRRALAKLRVALAAKGLTLDAIYRHPEWPVDERVRSASVMAIIRNSYPLD